jgi:hypothetical protein
MERSRKRQRLETPKERRLSLEAKADASLVAKHHNFAVECKKNTKKAQSRQKAISIKAVEAMIDEHVGEFLLANSSILSMFLRQQAIVARRFIVSALQQNKISTGTIKSSCPTLYAACQQDQENKVNCMEMAKVTVYGAARFFLLNHLPFTLREYKGKYAGSYRERELGRALPVRLDIVHGLEFVMDVMFQKRHLRPLQVQDRKHGKGFLGAKFGRSFVGVFLSDLDLLRNRYTSMTNNLPLSAPLIRLVYDYCL